MVTSRFYPSHDSKPANVLTREIPSPSFPIVYIGSLGLVNLKGPREDHAKCSWGIQVAELCNCLYTTWLAGQVLERSVARSDRCR